MVYYLQVSYEMNKKTCWEEFMIDIKDPTEAHKILPNLLNRNYMVNPNSVVVRTSIPFYKVDKLNQYKASKNVIYRDVNFNVWKLSHSEYPRTDILRVMRFERINIYFVSNTKNNDIDLNVNFIIMNLMIAREKVNILPFLSRDEHHDIRIYDIINSASPSILTIFVFPKDSNVSSILTTLNLTKGKDNFMFYINDNSNQIHRIEIDHDTIVFKKV